MVKYKLVITTIDTEVIMSRKSNFTFVYNHNSPKNEELYEFLYKLESQVKTQPMRSETQFVRFWKFCVPKKFVCTNWKRSF